MAAEKVSIDWPEDGKDYFRQRAASDFGIGVKNWLQQQGLLMYVDFEWQVNTTDKTIDITFFNKTHYATMVVLKFQGTH